MAKPIMNERTIADYMKRNKCDRDEAIELIKYDIAVEDDEETEYDLTEEQKKVVQEMNRKIDHKKNANVKRERKPNELKEALVAALADYLENACEFVLNGETTYCGDVEITNKNRMIHFTSSGKEFDLQLVEKRPKKEEK
jgi:hypothetical protein